MLVEVETVTATLVAVAPWEAGVASVVADWHGVPVRPAAAGESVAGLLQFGAASVALDRAVELQRRTLRWGSRPLVRIGVAVGDVTDDGAGLRGRVVDEALALVERAAPGQILMTDLVDRVGASNGRRHLLPVGVLDGHGVGDAPEVLVLELRWSPLPCVGGVTLAPPWALTTPSALPFVGRQAAEVALEDAWRAAMDGGPRFSVVTAEAGAGKTRLVAEFGRSVYERGGVVLWGACSEFGDVPYQPFVDAIHGLLQPLDLDLRLQIAGDVAADLAVLVPRLFPPADRSGASSDPAASRYWMFEAVAQVVDRLGRDAPVLLVIDDLQWAERPTGLLLRHLLRGGGPQRLCVVATSRQGQLTEAAEEVQREVARAGGLPIQLEGLAEDEVADVVSGLVGHRLDGRLRDLASHLHGSTSGNPFFVGQLWAHLVDSGLLERDRLGWRVAGDPRSTPSPRSVREVIGQRLARLSAGAGTVLPVAAVAGSPFDASLVARAAHLDISLTLAALDEAIAAGMIVDTAPGSYRFRHDLVAQGLVDNQAPGSLAGAHLALARALEEDEPRRPSLIAHHYTRAVPLVPPSVAASWAQHVAHLAPHGVSYEGAAATLIETLAVVTDPHLRADLLIEHSRVAALGGDLPTSHASGREAAQLARSIGDPGRLVAAALVFHELTFRSGGSLRPEAELVEAALDVADDADRARLLATQSTVLSFSGREQDAIAVGDQAVELARRLGDDALLPRVMHATMFSGWRSPARLEDRLALTTEATELARRSGDSEAVMPILFKQSFGLSALGRGRRLREVADEIAVLAARVRQPWYLAANSALQSAVALAEGRLADAEAAISEFERWASMSDEPTSGLGLLVFGLRREQGRLAEVRPVIELMARLGEDAASWGPGLAALYADVGLLDEASRLLDGLLAEGRPPVPDDNLELVTLSYLADACAATAHRNAAAVYDALLPWSGRAIWAPGLACYGAVDRHLGTLAAVMGRGREAGAHLGAALELDEDAGWRTWSAHTRFALARLLLDRARSGDRQRALAELAAALALAEDIGLAGLAGRCRALIDGPTPRADRRVDLSRRELDILHLLADGLTNREIGERLYTSQHTVANQMHSILVKSGCANRTEAVAWAQRCGHLDPPD